MEIDGNTWECMMKGVKWVGGLQFLWVVDFSFGPLHYGQPNYYFQYFNELLSSPLVQKYGKFGRWPLSLSATMWSGPKFSWTSLEKGVEGHHEHLGVSELSFWKEWRWAYTTSKNTPKPSITMVGFRNLPFIKKKDCLYLTTLCSVNIGQEDNGKWCYIYRGE